MSNERWEWVKGYENLYKISNYGNIKSFHIDLNGKELLKYKAKDGYYSISLFKDGNECKIRIHRIVALTFIKKDIKYNIVNHIDSNKENNHVDNLEWCDHDKNNKHKNFNLELHNHNTSGYKHISYRNSINKWRFKITINKINYDSYFDTLEEAIEAKNSFIIENNLQHLHKIILA